MLSYEHDIYIYKYLYTYVYIFILLLVAMIWILLRVFMCVFPIYPQKSRCSFRCFHQILMYPCAMDGYILPGALYEGLWGAMDGVTRHSYSHVWTHHFDFHPQWKVWTSNSLFLLSPSKKSWTDPSSTKKSVDRRRDIFYPHPERKVWTSTSPFFLPCIG